jgi:hypothetical protein
MLIVYSSLRDFAAYVDCVIPKKVSRVYVIDLMVVGKEPRVEAPKVGDDSGPFSDDHSNDSTFALEIAQNSMEDIEEILEDSESDEEQDIVSDNDTLSMDSQATTSESESEAVFTEDEQPAPDGHSTDRDSVSPTIECYGEESADPYSWFVPRHPDSDDSDDTSTS